MSEGIDLKLAELLVILFTTFGPVKLILPFNALTEHLEYKDKLKVALESVIISLTVIIFVVLLGPNIVERWQLSRPAIAIAGGIILFFQGFVMALKNPVHMADSSILTETETTQEKTPLQLAHSLIIPAIITPAGIMVILSVSSLHHGEINDLVFLLLKTICGIFILNLVTMMLTPFICKVVKPVYFRILGWIFSIFIMILGVHIIIQAVLHIARSG